MVESIGEAKGHLTRAAVKSIRTAITFTARTSKKAAAPGPDNHSSG
jgi:hypothetical protein